MSECYFCWGENGHTLGCPETRDKQARDKVFPGMVTPTIVEPCDPIPPKVKSELGSVESEVIISIDGRAFYGFGTMGIIIPACGTLNVMNAYCHMANAKYLLECDRYQHLNVELLYQCREQNPVFYIGGTLSFVNVVHLDEVDSLVCFKYTGKLK